MPDKRFQDVALGLPAESAALRRDARGRPPTALESKPPAAPLPSATVDRRSDSVVPKLRRRLIVATAFGGLAVAAVASAAPALAATDRQPPTTPTKNHVTATTQTSVSLAWNKSTDNVGVTEYDVFKQGQQMVKVAGNKLTATVTNLTPGTQYVFTIVAR